MPTTVSMPQLGETVTEGTILRWLKQVGDAVATDEMLVEISTDKVDTEVPSPVTGVLREILAAEGETIQVGAPMAVIAAEGEAPAPQEAPAPPEPAPEPAPAPSVAEPAPAPPEPAPAPEPVPAPPVAEPAPAPPEPAPAPPVAEAASSAAGFLSPVVRKLAREHGVDPAEVTGTGRDGRVTRNDLLAYIESAASRPAPEPAPAPAEPAPAPAPAVPAPAPVPATAVVPGEGLAARRGDEVRDIDRLRARIAANMVKSKQTAAHVWTSMEVDFEAVERVRRAHRERFRAAEGFSLTYLPFIARATMDALREYPVVNSSFHYEERRAVFHQDIHLGIAVDLDQAGLLVATIREAGDYTLRGLARKIRDVGERARSGDLGPDDISVSTFTITNPGPHGSFISAPVINLPNVAILSTDTIAKRPKVVTTVDGQDTIAVRHLGYLGFSWDHRAFDGSTASLFLRRIRDNLETWDWEQQLV